MSLSLGINIHSWCTHDPVMYLFALLIHTDITSILVPEFFTTKLRNLINTSHKTELSFAEGVIANWQ